MDPNALRSQTRVAANPTSGASSEFVREYLVQMGQGDSSGGRTVPVWAGRTSGRGPWG